MIHCTKSACRIICMLFQQTSPKRWFANVNMTSYCDVTNSAFSVLMTTIRHCSILKFSRGGAYNHAVAPGITRPLHGTGHDAPRLTKLFGIVLTLFPGSQTHLSTCRHAADIRVNRELKSTEKDKSYKHFDCFCSQN